MPGFSKNSLLPDSADTYTMNRLAMVETQIKQRGISDKNVLAAMEKVPRHRFVPENVIKYAYEDEPLPIGSGQTISQPYIVALMTELLELKKHSKVLEIGTGSGYQAAVLAELCDSVYSIEIVCELADRADSILKALDYNATVKCGDGYQGWPDHAPFEAIIVTAAPEKIPQPLLDQLAEGGRLVIPVGSHNQELKLIRKESGKIKEMNVIPVRFVPMTGEAEK
ncbi:MAG: protein-L-isoaspartate(D-aspartate) O-methyltransferase [candidate division Zixibacteria bacterium]|nr:protein-L-isoaspartate(D-aspartate) O-methyltransferase [candidate division Zixibacteria bacterium]